MKKSAARILSAALALVAFVAGDLQAQPRVTGSVATPDGKPFAAATVELLPFLPGFAAGRLRLEDREVQPATAAMADLRGFFALTAPQEGVYRVRVSAPGRLPMQSGLLTLVEDAELPPVELREDAGLSLRLADSQGRPVEGLWIVAEPAGAAGKPQRIAAWQPALRIGRTDREGRVVLPRFAGEQVAVTWFETGTAARGTRILEGPETLTLPAPSAAWRQIRTVDPEGRGLAGLLLRAGPQAWPVGVTDEQGGLRVGGWPEQSLELRVTDSQGFSFSRTASTQEGQQVTLEVPVPGPFSGRVYDAGSGRPVAGALVWPVSDPGSLVRSGADGRFQHRAPEPGTFWLEAVAPGYLQKRIPVSPAQMRPGRGPAIALTRAERIRGQVVDAAGAPVPGAWIAAELENPGDRPPSSGAESAADGGASGPGGAFELRRLRPGLGYALRVQKPGYLPATASAMAPHLSLKITLQPSPRASGEVRDLQGLPVAGAEVEIAPGGRRPRGEEKEALRTATDAQGRFAFAELPAIEVDLAVRKAGYAEAAFRGLQLPAGRPAVDLGRIVLRPGATLQGRVLDPRKRPVAGARIYQVEDPSRVEQLAAALAEEEPEAVSSGRGDFALPDRPAGSAIHLLVLAEGYRPETVRGARVPAPEPLTVTLADAFAMHGRVLDESGEPVKGARVEIAWQETVSGVPGQLPSGRELSRGGTTDGEGRFRLAGLPAGESDITILAEGFLPLEGQKLVLPLAEPAESPAFVLGRGATLEGRVTAGDVPVRGARIAAGSAGAALSDDDGFYAVAGVAPGETDVKLSHPHYPDQRQRQTLAAGLNRLDFQLPAGQEVRGQVLDEERRPVPAARVVLRLGTRIGYREYRAQSGHDGSFELSPVADGRYLLEASADEYAEGGARKPVVVAGEPVDGLEVILPRGADLVGRVNGLDRGDLWRLRVQATDEGGRSYPARLDTDGRYELRGLRLGSWQVQASLGDGERQAQARAELRQGGEVVERDLEFAERLRLTGRVLFADEPLPAARVALRADRLAVERAVLTDHDGRFELEDLEPDSYWLGVSHARKLVVHNGRLTLAADRDLLLDLEAVNVHGTVVDAATDRPIPGAVVSLEHQPGPDTSEFVIASSADDGGAFVLPRVPPGRYRLRGRADGYVAGEEGLDVPAQEELSGVRLALTPTPGLEAVARLASGRVPPMIHFRAVSTAGGMHPETITGSQAPDAEGRVRLPTPSQGSWRLLIGAPGCGAVEVPAQSPGPPVSVVLPPAARLSVQVPDLATADVRAEVAVLGPDGSPVPVLGPGGALRQTWPMVGGKTTIEDLPAGTWTVDATAGDGRRWTTTVVAPGAASVPVVLE